MAQEEDFYAALIRDKRFAEDVGNVVVEFGDASQQDTLDRYLAGEDVPYDQLRRVWSDTVGWIPTVTALGYINFYAQVRHVNLGLPPEHRIHIWLGDPPIDWSTIKTNEEFLPYLNERNQYPAEIIKTQILAKNRKALVIYGTFHFFGGKNMLAPLVDSIQPGAFFVVVPYVGFIERSCSVAFEQVTSNWPIPALATPVRRSSLESKLRTQGCYFMPASAIGLGQNTTEPEKRKQLEQMEEWTSGVDGDALLYLGPADNLTQSQESPDLTLDPKFGAEIDRRMFIAIGSHLGPWTARQVSPLYIHPHSEVDAGAAK
jgi:hypothetical protein